jgi:Zn-dependent protease
MTLIVTNIDSRCYAVPLPETGTEIAPCWNKGDSPKVKWSWKLGRYAGIDVYIHMTFVLLIAFIAVSNWLAGQSFAAAGSGVAFVLAIFGCVLLHEFGHALAARKYGIRTRDITLYPIGGVARLERMPDKPMQEFWVAIAGPLVNVVIAGAIFAFLSLTAGIGAPQSLGVAAGPFLERLMAVNVLLVAFNMLPAFPMDGGRVVRALLATRMDYVRATNVAATLGQGMAFLFGFIGFFTNPFLLFIAFFVWIGASQEAGMAQIKSALGGIPVSRAMITDFQTTQPGDTLGHVVELILAGSQQDFPVVDAGNVVGVLTRSGLIHGLTSHGRNARVEDVMHRDFAVVDSVEMLESVFMRLQECKCHTVPVLSRGNLVGLMTTENMGEFLMIQAALTGKPVKR